MSKDEDQLRLQYGKNQQITDGNYEELLAVKCINGTFVGKKAENIISYKGIPFVGQQPVGNLLLLRTSFSFRAATRMK